MKLIYPQRAISTFFMKIEPNWEKPTDDRYRCTAGPQTSPNQPFASTHSAVAAADAFGLEAAVEIPLKRPFGLARRFQSRAIHQANPVVVAAARSVIDEKHNGWYASFPTHPFFG